MEFTSKTNKPDEREFEILKKGLNRVGGMLLEHEAYEILKLIGVNLPNYVFLQKGEGSEKLKLPNKGPFVAKAILEGETHKTEREAIAFHVTEDKIADLVSNWNKKFTGDDFKGILFVEQIPHSPRLGTELLFGFYQDTFFGPVLAVGLGGTATEYYGKIMNRGKANVFWPANASLKDAKDLVANISSIELMEGKVRGHRRSANIDDVLNILEKFQKLALTYSDSNENSEIVISECEINPAAVHDGKLWALDAVIRVRKRKAKISLKNIEYIKSLLAPKSAIVAGVSTKNPNAPSGIILRKLRKAGISEDKLFILHPKEKELMGIKAYSSLDEIKKANDGNPADVFVVGVPAEGATNLILDSFEKNVAKSYEVITAGFGETSGGQKRQVAIEDALQSLPIDKRPVLNGPNTLGNIYLKKYDTLFTPSYKSSANGEGKDNIALICQSGAFMITRLSDMPNVIYPKMSVSVGNQLDLSVVDFLEYGLKKHPEISVFALYVEGLKPGDGERLIRLSNEALKTNRLVVIYRSGRTPEGQEAAKGHTAAMAGDYEMFKDFMNLSGAVVARRVIEFQNIITAASYVPEIIKVKQKKSVNVVAVSNAGYEKCALADNLTSYGNSIKLAELSDKTKEKIKMVFDRCRITGIVDLHAVLDLTPMCDDVGYYEIAKALLEDKNVDVGLFSIVPETVVLDTLPKSTEYDEDFAKKNGLLELMAKLRNESKKPFVMSLESGVKYDPLAHALMDSGIPCFRYVDSAARTLAKIIS